MQTSRHLHYLHPNLSGKNTNEHTFARFLINLLDCLHAFEYHKYLCYFKFSSVEPSIILYTCDIIHEIEHLSLDINNSSIHSNPSSWQCLCESGRRKTWSMQFQAYSMPPFIFLITLFWFKWKRKAFSKFYLSSLLMGLRVISSRL